MTVSKRTDLTGNITCTEPAMKDFRNFLLIIELEKIQTLGYEEKASVESQQVHGTTS